MMKKFKVVNTQQVRQTYEQIVEAKNEDEALEKANKWDWGNIIDERMGNENEFEATEIK